MTAVQPDLFGEFDAAADELATVRRRREEDRARYERREFISAYDTTGHKEGERILGWVCPACGGICWGEFTLSLNHGYDPGRFEWYPAQWTGDPWGTWCHRTIRRAYREEHDMPVEEIDDERSMDDVGVIRIEATP